MSMAARQRYSVTEKEPMPSGTRQFRVLTDSEVDTPWLGRDVWAFEQFGRWVCQCTECSSATVAMLASCAHAKAVARHLDRQCIP